MKPALTGRQFPLPGGPCDRTREVIAPFFSVGGGATVYDPIPRSDPSIDLALPTR